MTEMIEATRHTPIFLSSEEVDALNLLQKECGAVVAAANELTGPSDRRTNEVSIRSLVVANATATVAVRARLQRMLDMA